MVYLLACFITPAIIGAIVSIVKRFSKTSGERLKLGALEAMLWGGSILLAFEHVWHGEVVPYPPFLTAAMAPGAWGTILHEIATVGGAMSLAVTAVWGGILAVPKLLGAFMPAQRSEAKAGISKAVS